MKITVDRRQWLRYDGQIKRIEDAVYSILRRQDRREQKRTEIVRTARAERSGRPGRLHVTPTVRRSAGLSGDGCANDPASTEIDGTQSGM